MRRLLTTIGLSVVSVFATLVLLEGVVRIVDPQDLTFWDSHQFRRIRATAPHFVENAPNARAGFTGVSISINSVGLRDEEISIPKPPNTVRILTVGDSITFGYGIPLEDTYSKVLQKRLNRNPPRAMRYEVLNGGTLGGSLGDYLYFLQQKAEKLQPDAIVIGVSLNDILLYSKAGGVSEAGATWRSGRPPFPKRINELLLHHSQLYVFCYARLRSFLFGSGILDINRVRGLDFVTLSPPTEYQRKAWESSFDMLSQIIAFCDGHDYRLLVVVFPMQMQLSPSDLHFYRERYHLRLGDEALSGEPQKRLREFANMSNISLVDLLPAYRAHLSEQLYLHNRLVPSDPSHPSIRGHEIAADEILAPLVQILGISPAGRK